MTNKIDAAFVAEWADKYDWSVDDEVLTEVHPAVHDRETPYFTKAEGEAVIKWKSTCTLPLFQANSESVAGHTGIVPLRRRPEDTTTAR